MSAEIICVGTELLLGDITNTNAQFLAQQLASLGIPHYFQTTVGDNLQRIHQVIELASQRASILLFTGGLGPTPDDLTTEAIASFFNAPLVEHPDIIADIAQKFASMGRKMSKNNRKQALIPQGAEILPNLKGTAPGLIWQPRPHLTILTFPGVPSEMKHMWQETAIPYLKRQGWGQEIIYSRMMRFRGIGESALAEKVAHLFDLTNPTVAPYASLGEVKLRVTAKARSQAEAIALIEPVAQEIQTIAGLDYFGCNEDTLASVVGQLLRQSKETVSVAESCTGGGLGSLLTEISGSSDYFLGGVIAYNNRIKIEFLGVNPDDLAQYGAVSDLIAQQMALGIQQRSQTDWGLSVTGIAGPEGGTQTKPVGLVYLGIAKPSGQVESIKCQFGQQRAPSGDSVAARATIRYLSACTALDCLRRELKIVRPKR